MIDVYKDISEALEYYGSSILEKTPVRSANRKNTNTYKNELIEVHPAFFAVEDPTKVLYNFDNYKSQPYWVAGEIITEMLGLNPPMIINYRPDIVEWSYDLLDSGRVCYSYGSRWQNHNSIEKTVARLMSDKTSKRLYVPIFDQNDVGDTRDAPCNLGFLLLCRDNKLDLTLFARSIDVMRGFRYDPALFSFLQQMLASVVRVDVGKFYYYCNSLHCYSQDVSKLESAIDDIKNKRGEMKSLVVDRGIELRKIYDDMRHLYEMDAILRKTSDKIDVNALNYDISKEFAKILIVKNT